MGPDLYEMGPDSSLQHITISLVKALGSYDPLFQKNHPKLSTIKEIYEGETRRSLLAPTP